MAGWRWHDINNGDFIDQKSTADFIGHAQDADLWLTNHGVLICQYQDEDHFQSYHPAGAIIHRVKGGTMAENVSSMSIDVKSVQATDAPIWWGQVPNGHAVEQVRYIARYLATFAPSLFTEEQRNEALGFALTEKENGE